MRAHYLKTHGHYKNSVLTTEKNAFSIISAKNSMDTIVDSVQKGGAFPWPPAGIELAWLYSQPIAKLGERGR
jgi:hypothetical protein